MKNSPFDLSLTVAFVLMASFASTALADPSGDNLFPAGRFDEVALTYNPWAGVDGDNHIHGIAGSQLAVGDAGNLYNGIFGPSVAVGDMNGDQKQDLVMADSRGYFWYYPNSGTVKQPKFTQGQVMPIWLGENPDLGSEGVDNIVPRIQLVDLSDDAKLSLAIGTYAGKLFFVHNRGSANEPNFPVTLDASRYLIPTHTKGTLWCNYLAPCLYHWFNPSVLDLVTGEGTYSANSIYLLRNMNPNGSPGFSEANQQKIIPGMGLEQLTPCVVDWNNDGKPDIISGDRTGFLNLFLNTSTDPSHPTFDTGKHITVGGNEKLGNFTTVTVGDLSGNKLPNLVIGTDAGTVFYAENKGKLGAPEFPDPPVILTGENPYPKITVPTNWSRGGPPGVPDELVIAVNPDLEKGFEFPPGETTKYAMKFEVFPIQDPIFHERYYPTTETGGHVHSIACGVGTLPLKAKTRYQIHGWIKGDANVRNLTMGLSSTWLTAAGPGGEGKSIPISFSSSWGEINTDVRFELKGLEAAQFAVGFSFTGQGTFYLDDLTIREDK